MYVRDLDILRRIDDQILGVSGEELLLPEHNEFPLRRTIHRAMRSQLSEDIYQAYLLFWNDVRVRRMPWDYGIRSYIGWRLHHTIDDLITNIIATDLASNERVGHAVGRDDKGLWFPEIVLNSIVIDLELDEHGSSPLLTLLDIESPGPLSAASTWIAWLMPLTQQSPKAVLIKSPAYWSLTPGWHIPAAVTRHYRTLADAYCQRVVSIATYLSQHDCPLGDIQTRVPARMRWQAPLEVVNAVQAIERVVDLDAMRELIEAIPMPFRALVLSRERDMTMGETLRDFLVTLIARHLLTGTFTISPHDTHTFLNRPMRPYEQAAVITLPDGRLAVSAGIIPSALTHLGLLPEAPVGIGGHLTANYSWDTLSQQLGWHDLLLYMWPDRHVIHDGSHPHTGEWLILPPHHLAIFDEAIRRNMDVHYADDTQEVML